MLKIKDFIQKMLEPNYIKIYKQIEQAFFNKRKITLGVTKDELKAMNKFYEDYSEYEEIIEEVATSKTGYELKQEKIPRDIKLYCKYSLALNEDDFNTKEFTFDFRNLNMDKLFEIRHTT